jgi:hypothetical protein
MTTEQWNTRAASLLKGRTIVDVSYFSAQETRELGWAHSAVVLTLDDGTFVYPMRDGEGNDAGALQVGNCTLPVL